MRSGVLLLAALSALPASAQLQLFVVNGGAERPVGAQLDLGSVAAGDTFDTRFRIRNTGAAAADVQLISAAGTGFSIADGPPYHYLVAAAASVDFTVRLHPLSPGGYSANLTVYFSSGVASSRIEVLLHAAAVGSLTLLVEQQGGMREIVNSETVDFGRVVRGSSVSRRFAIENRTPAPFSVSRLAALGSGFHLAQTPELPAALAPGTSIAFEVVFEPQDAAPASGTLEMDQRTFRLSGSGINPPLPLPRIVVESQALSSASQSRVSVRFDPAARVAGKGTLRIDLAASVPGPSDPTAVFATGGRAVEFSFEEGDQVARFDGAPSVGFQTGSTAGTIIFTAQLGDISDWANLVIAPAPIGIQFVRPSRTAFNVTVDIAGYDNTRSAGQAAFTFYNTAGTAMATIRTDPAAAFRRYFESSVTGGAFLLHAVFPVNGSTAEIAAVEVEMVNSTGMSRSPRASF